MTSYRLTLALIVIVLLIYSNTLDAEWHFDDRHSITDNSKIQLSELTVKSLSQAIEHPDASRIWRPLAYLSFSLNWYIGQDNVFGYHVVNILIHCVTAYLLFQVLLILFNSPNLNGRHAGDPFTISLLSAIMWAINPIHTQAVTYIVQRMTLLAALFYMGGVLFYLRARITKSSHYRFLYFTLCLVSGLLALASKENAILLPLGIILVEVIFFQDLTNYDFLKRFLLISIFVSIAIAIIGYIIFPQAHLLYLFAGYEDRFFTPWERILTQPRIVLFYITQIFYPHPARLSIEHEFVTSTTIIHPWTTLPAIIFIFALVLFAFVKAERWPISCFAILFFFLNHLIESSIIPLEMIFEHRNYLPSMFLFVPIAQGTVWLLNRYSKTQTFLFLMTLCLGIGLIIALSIGTYLRNHVWRTEESLWTDAHLKAPSMHRPIHNLAMALYDRQGNLDKALEFYHRAEKLTMHRKSHKALLYSNIANIHFRKGRYDEAESYYRKALEITPNKKYIRFRLAETLVKKRNWNSALRYLDRLLLEDERNGDYHNLKGIILLRQHKPDQALSAFRVSFREDRQRSEPYINAGRALTVMGKFDQAEKLYTYGIELAPNNLKTYIRLLDVYIKSGRTKSVEIMSRFLIDSASIRDIIMTFDDLSNDPSIDSEDHNNMRTAINLALENQICTDTIEKQ